MSLPNTPAESKVNSQSDGAGFLFEYAVKFLLLAGFLELVLYRLVSRLGMHLSKISEKYAFVKITFQTLSSLGFVLLNVTSILLFLVIFILLIQKIQQISWTGWPDSVLVPSVSLLVLLTVVFLVFPPAMLGAVLYNLVSLAVLVILGTQFMQSHHVVSQRVAVGSFLLGIGGWIYYQTMSTGYGYFGVLNPPPLVHEINRIGEALMVLASILVFWAYGSTPFFTKNKAQKRRAMTLLASGGTVFFVLLFLDFFLLLYDENMAEEARKAGQGIGWIFQMGMGYTFYLPFAFYMAGLICWAYTIIKLVLIGRLAGYGLGLMFMAGYALQLSHLTLMVVVGLMLLNMDKRGTFGKLRVKSKNDLENDLVYSSAPTMLGEAR